MPLDDAPVVSVVVLGWNGRRYVEACLGSLLDQVEDTPTHEIIWVDNGSADGTADVVGTMFPSVRLVRFDRNLGYAAGNVAALAYARGRLVAFLNQDTVVSREWIRALVQAQRATGAAAVHSNMILPWQACAAGFDRSAPHRDLHVAELSPAAFVRYRVEPFAMTRETLFVSGAGFMIDREVVPQIGGLFEPRFWAYCEDTDLALRLAAHGHRVVIAGEAVLFHDLTPDVSMSIAALRKTLLILRNRFLACWRSMTAAEFLTTLPRLILGAGAKADEVPLPTVHRIVARVLMVALAVAATVWAAYEMPHHGLTRRNVLARRVGGPQATAQLLRRLRG